MENGVNGVYKERNIRGNGGALTSGNSETAYIYV